MDGVAGECRTVAEVLPPTFTEGAYTAGFVQPRNSNPCAFTISPRVFARAFNQTDDLVSGNNAWPLWSELPFDYVQIGAADTARCDLDEYLSFTRFRDRKFCEREWVLFHGGGAGERPGLHWTASREFGLFAQQMSQGLAQGKRPLSLGHIRVDERKALIWMPGA